jgi:hypothetical protein
LGGGYEKRQLEWLRARAHTELPDLPAWYCKGLPKHTAVGIYRLQVCCKYCSGVWWAPSTVGKLLCESGMYRKRCLQG